MKKVKSEPIILVAIFAIAVLVFGVVAVIGNQNTVEVSKSNLENELNEEMKKMQSSYDPYVKLDKKEEIKNEMPDIKANDGQVKKIEVFNYPCDKSSMKIVDNFDKKYIGADRSYLEALTLTPAFNKGCPGMVFRLPENSPVYACSNGVVKTVIDNTSKNGGYYVEIENTNGVVTIYSGLKDVKVEENYKVTKEQKIGTIGNINNMLLNNELRFYVLEGTGLVDPVKYIGK